MRAVLRDMQVTRQQCHHCAHVHSLKHCAVLASIPLPDLTARERAQVTNGKGQMPAWDGTLDEDEIEAVANYVYATANADAW
jgi:Cytochrome C oxidase, cbb3-type, subunit III